MSWQYIVPIVGGLFAAASIALTILPERSRIAAVLRGDELRAAPVDPLSSLPERQRRVICRANHETYKARWRETQRRGANAFARLLPGGRP